MSTPESPDDLQQWLNEQLQRLRSLEAVGQTLKINFVQNAREKGDILIAIEERLHGSPLSFRQWVVRDTDIGYSTALLWMDLARHYDVVRERFANSNPLELTVRGIRDAIRDHRQGQGGGKPGSGRKITTEGPGADASKAPVTDDGDPADLPNHGEAMDPAEEKAPSTDEPYPDAANAKAEAVAPKSGGTTRPAPALGKATVVVTVFSDSDQAVFREALTDWSPVTKHLGGSKHLATLSASAPARDIDTLMGKLAVALKEILPRKAAVRIDL